MDLAEMLRLQVMLDRNERLKRNEMHRLSPPVGAMVAAVDGPLQQPSSSYYDDETLLRDYLAHRHAPVTSPNLVMEEPAFFAEVGSLADLRILDLGCGDGTFAAQCLADGARSYVGIDSSAMMLAEAKALVDDRRASFVHAELESMVPEPGAFDLVTSRMALHYVADVDPVFAAVRAALADGGRFVSTMLHPAVSAGNAEHDGPRTHQVVTDYFHPGARHRTWFGRQVTWYHRTIEQYIAGLAGNGLRLDTFGECPPVPELFAGDSAELDRRRQVPLFLLLSASAA